MEGWIKFNGSFDAWMGGSMMASLCYGQGAQTCSMPPLIMHTSSCFAASALLQVVSVADY